MHYIVYKITNQINGKFYVGVHKTKNIDDGYMGSGKHLKRAQAKYGIENFKKEVLFVFDNAKDMYHKEAEIVNEDFVNSAETYNLMEGGRGGFDHINRQLTVTDRTVNANKAAHTIRTKIHQNPEFCQHMYSAWSRAGIAKAEKVHSRRKVDPEYDRQWRESSLNHFKGKSHTEETKAKIGKANSITQSGSGNSQYGTRWIYSPTEKISKKNTERSTIT